MQNGTYIDLTMSYHYRLVGGSLAINNPHTKQDIGTYQCLATNSFGTILSRKAKLQFAYLGHFETKTRSTVSVREGQGVVLLCGPPPHYGGIVFSSEFFPSISWKRSDGHPLGWKIKHYKSKAVLEIPDFQQEDEGSYECTAGNIRGRNIAKGQLIIYALPQWDIKIQNAYLSLYDNLFWECKASGKPSPSYSWLKNGQPFVPEERIQIENGTLTVTMLNMSDSGLYQCVAENKYDTIYTNAELRVIAAAPDFSKNPVKQISIAQVGGEVTIECKPNASPKAVINRIKGTNILQQNKRVFMLEDGSLKIYNITKTDAGAYICIAMNQFGIARNSGTLIVKERTVITVPPSKMDVTVGESIVLPCQVSHDLSTDVVFTWSFNGDVIDFTRGVNHFERIGGESVGDLMIRNIQLHYSGKYVCMVQTTIDSLSATGDVIVRGKSIKEYNFPVVVPTHVNGGGGSCSKLVITWESVPEELQNGEGFGYIIMFQPLGSTTWMKVVVASVETSKYVYRNESITPLSPFEVKVGVYNNESEGILSSISIVYLGEDEPQSPLHGTGIQEGYLVLYWTDDSKETAASKVSINGNVTAKNITGLKANTLYFATVRAYNTGGTGPPSAPVNITTKKSPNITWTVTNSKICLNWEHVKTMENESEVLGYNIFYRQHRQSKTHILETNNTSAELLVPFEEDYLIEIRTVRDGGDGSSSEEIKITKMSNLSSQATKSSELVVHVVTIGVMILRCILASSAL
uniref:Contactin 6 n=1 Tax=Pelusios castaneus TaxID=367368 RepID=A0A8C8RW21_9SAUR